MLGSFGVGSSSSHHHEEEEEDPSPPPPPNVYHHHNILPYSSTHIPALPIQMRQLLIACAELVSASDLSAAHRLLTLLSTNSSPYGDSTQRLIHQFTKSLSLRLNRHVTAPVENTTLQSSYLSLNQITPFLRFSHLTANQAILESINNSRRHHQSIHVIDFDINHGVQWPPLMQALAELYPPPTLRITGTGNNLNILRKTGDRLSKFAHSLHLHFQFHPLLLTSDDPISLITSIPLRTNEILAVNCVHYLHRLLTDRDRLCVLLHQIRSMNPTVFTVCENEANHNHPVFVRRFSDALDHYSAVFDSLEATVPPSSEERLAVEGTWFGREIADIVAEEGERRRERHQVFRSWEVLLRGYGFVNLPLSPFAVSQAKLLLRLHYPSEGYRIHVADDCCLLGWQNQPLYSFEALTLISFCCCMELKEFFLEC